MSLIERNDLISLIEVALEQDSGSLSQNSRAEDIEKWDSLGHLNILVALDSQCNGKVAGISAMATADSIQKIIEILENNSLLKD